MKKFNKTDLQELVCGGAVDNLEIVEENIEDQTRWSVIYELIFKDTNTDKFYRTAYSVGATEYQDESPFEYDDDEIECREVGPVEVTVVQYKPVEK